ncbi:hypothetical protein J8J14_24045 [Roseomonas sp. SSH11]|uniref:Uncharacterized protein n=1 Tax=Pararoseomonas baculiformis TaxID=2820812 RepID=A0ABS4AMS0_9PROT|nr:hypothetical protein [Pararoseomonas baculiformis]MBP0447818.1 hypothetical protein [Pararoseomonas baculiformis]
MDVTAEFRDETVRSVKRLGNDQEDTQDHLTRTASKLEQLLRVLSDLMPRDDLRVRQPDPPADRTIN